MGIDHESSMVTVLNIKRSTRTKQPLSTSASVDLGLPAGGPSYNLHIDWVYQAYREGREVWKGND